MMYLNGQGVAPIIPKGKANLLNPSNAHLGTYSFTFNGNYAESSSTTRFCYGLIPVEVGKAYEVIAPQGATYSVLFVSGENKWRFDSGWIAAASYLFIATQPYICIQVQCLNSEFANYKDLIILQESDYKFQKIAIDTDVSNWEHKGISYASGRSFADAKSMNTDSSKFRYNNLINFGKYPLLIINETRYTIAVQQFDDEEKGRVDSGWQYGYEVNANAFYNNIALCGQAASSVAIADIVQNIADNLYIYKITGVE